LNADLKGGKDVDDIEIAMCDGDKDHPLIRVNEMEDVLCWHISEYE